MNLKIHHIMKVMKTVENKEQAEIKDINELKQSNIYTGDVEFWDKFDDNTKS